MISRVRLLATIASVMLVSGCATQHPRRLLDLETPMYAWHSESASCGKLRVVDGARRLWLESGCEGTTTGFVRGPTISPSAFAAIVKAFAGLPHQVPDCAPGAMSVDIFTSREDNVQKTWRLCPGDATERVPEDFGAVEAAFKALPK
jgi:hypothetical protein